MASFPGEHLEDFVLRPIMTALDSIEFDAASPDEAIVQASLTGKPVHAGVQQFAEHATRAYVAAHGRVDHEVVPVREWWVAQQVTEAAVWELYAWGRRYESPDGRLREFRFLRLGRVGSRDRARAEIAIAAYVTGLGTPAPWPEPWSEPFRPRDRAQPERVRVVDVGLVDGATAVLFDGSVEQVKQYFGEHGRREVGQIVAGGDAIPGSACVGCKRVGACPAPVRAPGLLGLDSSNGPLRSVSISGLRYYRRCPTQAYLRSVHLPRAYEYSAEAELGHAVHAWLEAAHMTTSTGACEAGALPPAGPAWSAGKWQVTGDLAEVGRQMLAHHATVCPFLEAPEIDSVRVEPPLTFLDSKARAIVLAKPDMVYREAGRWVWRELKTTQKAERSSLDPLREYPQLAFAVAALSMGVLGPGGGAGRVELEILRPGGADIIPIDPNDPERIETARDVLAGLSRSWRLDEMFEARPGRECQWCPVSQWCPSYPGPDIDGKDHDAGATSTTVET